ncbi:MAG: hypothetical protein ACK4KW_03770 [Gemmobacter sp.]
MPSLDTIVIALAPLVLLTFGVLAGILAAAPRPVPRRLTAPARPKPPRRR